MQGLRHTAACRHGANPHIFERRPTFPDARRFGIRWLELEWPLLIQYCQHGRARALQEQRTCARSEQSVRHSAHIPASENDEPNRFPASEGTPGWLDDFAVPVLNGDYAPGGKTFAVQGTIDS